MSRTSVAAAVVLLAVCAAPLHADEWKVGAGIAYVSGLDNVFDRYKNNQNATGQPAEIDKPIPLGVSFDAHFEKTSGVRVGGGLGPFLRLRGAKRHLEVPINVTVGYAFQQGANTAPYVKVGVVRHLVSGDYYVSSTAGVLAAAGLEFKRSSSSRYALEVSIDQSKIELQVLCGPAAATCQSGTEKVRSYDAVVSFFVKF